MDVKKIVSEMTLEEKAGMCSGWDFWHTKPVERLGVPKMMVSDGPHGLRTSSGNGINDSKVSVCFPSSAGLAASFNRALAARQGDTLGKEARSFGLGVLLGPAINIKRSPLCGRNFEYMSEDPYLAGELSAAYVNAVQSHNVGVSVKHFAANSQERRRTSVSAIVDERTLREIYFPAFETTVKKAQPWTVMCSYNQINGCFSSENDWLLNKVLRGEWGFNGFVMSDWGAVNDRVKGVPAGLDLEMPSSGGVNDYRLVEAVKAGELDEKALDVCCENILRIVDLHVKNAKEPEYDREADHAIAREVARECMVLLKNDGILPLNKDKKVAFIGKFAKTPRYQGGGSSHINTYKVLGALEAAEGINKVYAEGYDDNGATCDKLIAEAVAAASGADVALVFAGLPDSYESEGFDRSHMDLPEGNNRLIEAVAAANPNTVVVLHNGSPVTMPWLDKVSAVLEAYLAGECSGGAAVDILFGDVNPSGKLAETFPVKLEDTSCYANFPGNPLTVEYREGIYVGYRYYERAGKDVLFPFGFGLSYTTFELSDIKVSATDVKAGDALTVSVTVKNTGDRDGAEVVQLYVGQRDNKIFKAVKELKGFEKVFLKAGEEAVVTFELDKRSFAYYDVEDGDWQVESGTYVLSVGSSSRDIALTAEVKVKGVEKDSKADLLPDYYTANVDAVTDAEFESLIGFELPPSARPEGSKLTADNTFSDAADTKWGKRILKLVRRFTKSNELGGADTVYMMAIETPFRCMMAMSGGMFSKKMLDGLLMMLNDDKPCKGLCKLLCGACGLPKNKRLAAKNKLHY